MSSLCICGYDLSVYKRNPYCQIHGDNQIESKPVLSGCSADHCTVEERAVIKAAIADRLAILNEGSAGPDALNKAADRAIAARRELNNAVIALMVARAGKNILTQKDT